jgi:hypothetical protein
MPGQGIGQQPVDRFARHILGHKSLPDAAR